MWRIAIVGLFVVLAPSAVNAQPSPFSTLDRASVSTRFGVDGALGFIDQGLIDITALHLDAYGQVMTSNGVGGYFDIPLAFVSIDAGAMDDSEFALGNIELGGAYGLRMRGYSLVGHLGIALPTGDSSIPGFLANQTAMLTRHTDLVLALPKTTAIRFGISGLLGTNSPFFGRIDAGVDVVVDEPEPRDTDPLVRLNVGGGYRAGNLAGMVEFANTFTSNPAGGSNDLTLHSLAFSARLVRSSWQPSLGFVVPFGDLKDIGLDFGLLFGIQHIGGF